MTDLNLLVDTHCHLDHERMEVSADQAVSMAHEQGIAWMVTIGTSLNNSENMASFIEPWDNVYATVGIHPEGTAIHRHQSQNVAKRLSNLLHQRHIVGVGETGLDYYYENSDRAAQAELFHAHCELAADAHKTLIVHSRDAERDTVDILQSHLKKKSFPVIIHCFTGSQWLADAMQEMGCMISLSGIVTFKNAKALQDTAMTIKPSHLLVETDSPYLAPTPKRGKVNQPSYVRYTAEYLANLRGESLSDLAQYTTANAHRIFAVQQPKS